MPTPPRANVVALPGADLPGLGMAATAFTGSRVTGSRNEIWLCPAYDNHGQPLMLYVKLGLPARAMLVEALCAQLASAMRLDAPEPYLVHVNPVHVGRGRGAKVLAFGSLDVSERSMAKPIRSLDVVLEALERLKIADLAACFDEWIANDVRSPSDILVSPESHLYLIDHEAAMDGATRSDAAVTNWLAARIIERTPAVERPVLLRNLRGRLAALHRIRLSPVPLAVQYCQDGALLYGTLLAFLTDRLTHLDRLLSTRVMPEQGYLSPTEPTTAETLNVSR
jgi:hypothetical protein